MAFDKHLFQGSTAANFSRPLIQALGDLPLRSFLGKPAAMLSSASSSPLVVFRTALAAISGNVFLGDAADDAPILAHAQASTHMAQGSCVE
jgi:hypothetical protein